MQAKLVAMFMSLFVAGGATVSYVVYKQQQEEARQVTTEIVQEEQEVIAEPAQPDPPPEPEIIDEPAPEIVVAEEQAFEVTPVEAVEPEPASKTAELIAALQTELEAEIEVQPEVIPAPTPTVETATNLVAQLQDLTPQVVQQPTPPSFDVVQISPDGQTLIAGKAEPNAIVDIFIDGTLLGTVTADEEGNWIYLPTEPILGGTRELSLVAKGSDGADLPSDAVVVAVFPTKPKIIAVAKIEPGPTPAPVAQIEVSLPAATPEPLPKIELIVEAEPVVELEPVVQAALEPKVEPEPTPEVVEVASIVEQPDPVVVPEPEVQEPEAPVGLAVLIPKKKNTGSKILQQAKGKATKTGSARFGVQTVDHDEEGNIVLSGRGVPAYKVLVYLDNQILGETIVTPASSWTLTPDTQIAPGSYIVRVDQIHPNGRVDARMEIPFTRDDTGRSELSKTRTVIVLPGNNLWRIARVAYGEGPRYTTIYDANKNQIKDPNLIYPGQIFVVPQGE
ncbi:LysM peptidoglycan-binding domain-containing protein [Alphaproteobacteria bacterium]|nr:LysM peptidoglycan-binding domain-containing protein [Alphaproteobacteria bacterium]